MTTLIGKILKNYPLFSALTARELLELEKLCVELTVAPQTKIVKEDEPVDSFALIMNGEAEIYKKGQLQGLLTAGQAIGLNETGLFSPSGIRSATVIATQPMKIIKINLSDFQEFLQKHPHLNAEMNNQINLLTKINFVKKILPFASLPIDKLVYLAKQLELRSLPAGEIIFKEGDVGDECYVIQQGEVEIYTKEKTLAQLTASKIFGEISLLTDLPRNASARTTQATELLVLKKAILLEVLQTKVSVARSLMKLVKKRSRPLRKDYIEVHHLVTDTNESKIILKDPINWNYCEISAEEFYIWNLLDGKHTLRELTMAVKKKFKMFNPALVAALITVLESEGYIDKITGSLIEEEDVSWQLKIAVKLKNIMEYSIDFGNNVDESVTRAYQKFFYLFYTWPAKIFFLLVTICGFLVFVWNFHSHINLLATTPYAGWITLGTGILATFSIILHELAHAFTAKSYGRGVATFGIGWYWYAVMAFCDTSDMWLSNYKERLAVDFAGIYCQLTLAGIASILTLFVGNPYLLLFLWLFAILHYLFCFYDLSPILELDGYYLLMDYLGRDNLREDSVLWLVKTFPNHWRHPRMLWKNYKAEVIYCSACIIYFCLQITVPYFIAKYLLLGLFGIQNIYYSLAISLGVLILSVLSTWGEIKQSRLA